MDRWQLRSTDVKYEFLFSTIQIKESGKNTLTIVPIQNSFAGQYYVFLLNQSSLVSDSFFPHELRKKKHKLSFMSESIGRHSI